jgi:ribosomal protein S18 acetylase RimI-like enzyme
MAWTLTGSTARYLAAAGDFLRSRPVEHTIELTVVQTLLARGPAAFGGPPLLGWWRSADGDVAASAVHTPPYPLLLSAPPPAGRPAAGPAAELAADLAARARPLPGVTAAAEQAAAFAAAWEGQTGAAWSQRRRSRLFRLGELAAPNPGPPGSARIAGETDRDLLAAWLADFAAEMDDLGGGATVLTDRLSYGGLTLWEVAGLPVALAGRTRPGHGVIRIGPVYTPPGQRRRGYGGAVTAAVSQAALDAGAAAVVLFTDLANPTSNALYARLGYRRVADRVILAFGPATRS